MMHEFVACFGCGINGDTCGNYCILQTSEYNK